MTIDDPPTRHAWLPLAAVAVHAGVLGLGVRGDPPPRRRLLPRRAVARAGSWSARSASAWSRSASAAAAADARGDWVSIVRDRRAVVRRLQRRAQRGRAARRRRHRRDADPGLAGADRAAGGDVPATSGSPSTSASASRSRSAASALIGTLGSAPAATATSSACCCACCAAVVYSISLVLQKPLVGPAPRAPRRPGWPAPSARRVPAVRRPAGRRDRRRAGVVDLVAGLPRRLPDGDRVHDVRLRAAAHDAPAASASRPTWSRRSRS